MLSNDNDKMDIFLKQLIQFYSNNSTNPHHLRHVAPQHTDCIVTTDYSDVISPHVWLCPVLHGQSGSG